MIGVSTLVLAAMLSTVASAAGTPITSANAAQVKLITSLKGHAQPVFSLAFSPNNHLLASGSIDHTARLWDMSTWTPKFTLNGHSAQVVDVAFTAEGATLETVGYDPAIRLWDTSNGQSTATQQKTSDGTDALHVSNLVVVFSADGETLAYGTDDGPNIFLWDMKASTQKTIQTNYSQSEGGYAGPSALAFSPDGKTLASTASDNTIQLWNVADGTLAATAAGPQGAIYSAALAFSTDGKTLASVDTNNSSIQLWDVSDLKNIKTGTLITSSDSGGSQARLSFSPDGSVLAASIYEKNVRLIDTKSGQILATLSPVDSDKDVAALAFSSDGRWLACGTLSGAVELWGIPAP